MFCFGKCIQIQRGGEWNCTRNFTLLPEVIYRRPFWVKSEKVPGACFCLFVLMVAEHLKIREWWDCLEESDDQEGTFSLGLFRPDLKYDPWSQVVVFQLPPRVAQW